MIGRDRITHQREDARARYRDRLVEILAHGEEWRLLDIGRVLPSVGAGVRDVDGSPGLGTGEHVRVLAVEHVRRNFNHRIGYLLIARPNIPQVQVLTVLALADRIGRQIDAGGSRDCVRDNQWRGCKPVGPHFLVHATLEIAIARQYRRDQQVTLDDRARDRLRQRTGVADAGRTTVADQIESELVELLL